MGERARAKVKGISSWPLKKEFLSRYTSKALEFLVVETWKPTIQEFANIEA